MRTQYTFICLQCGKQFTDHDKRRKFCSLSRGSSFYHPFNTIDDYWRNVDKSGGPDACWPWVGGRRNDGYGQMRWRGKKGKTLTHRIAWKLAHGEIPDGLDVCHTCDNPPCCNEAHLFLGTHADNNADKFAKGRCASVRGTDNGNSKLTWDEVRQIRKQYIPHTMGCYRLAEMYDVWPATIWCIVRNQTWRE